MNKVSFPAIQLIAKTVSPMVARSSEDLLAEIQHPIHSKTKAIEWNLFADWLNNLQSKYPQIDWRQIGKLSVQRSSNPVLVNVTRLTLSVRFAYWLAATWFGPSQFPVIKCKFEDTGKNQLRETLSIPPELVPCPALFEIFAGSLREAPKVAFDLPCASVEAQITGHHAIYDVTYPAHYPLWTRLKIFFSSFFEFPSLLQELAHQQIELQSRSQTLKTERNELKNLIEQFPDGFLIHREGIVQYLNPKLATLLNLQDPKQCYGQSIFDLVHPDDRKRVIEHMSLGAERFHKPYEVTLRLVDSYEPVLCEYTSIPITFEGQPATALVVRDLTDRKKLQAHLMLSDRMRALGQLAAGVGHEINTPLFFVMMKMEQLSQQNSQPENKPLLDDIHQGLERINSIVKQLKSFSRGESDEAPRPVDVTKSLSSALRMAQNLIEQRARLKVSISEAPPVTANEAQLGQVFLNLLLNAAQAIAAGRPEENEISVQITCPDGQNVQIEISDTGVGIPENIQPHLFQPFYTTKAIGEGTGLGLSICHSIVTRYRGQIEFTSHPGLGTTFRVTFPASAKAETASEPAKRSADQQLQSGRVLIIDDDQALLEVLESVVSSHFETVALTDGQEALKRIDAGMDFDCIICDLMMPRLDGQQFYLELLKRCPKYCERVFFLTGGSFSKRHDEFLNQPGIRYQEKPIDSASLIQTIREVILETRAQKEQAIHQARIDVHTANI